MRDDLPPRPVFQTAATDEDRPLEFRPSYNPVQPPEPLSPWRIAAIGAVAACALGVVVAIAIPGHDGGGQAKVKEAAKALPYRAISARYAPPDRARIAAAYEDAAKTVAQEGLSGAARSSMACFERLAQHPDYGLMDYCLALDAFGAQAYARAAGEAAPPSTYFGQGSVRRQQAVQLLTAGQTDANSRLIDTNRLIGEVALQAAVGSAPQPEAAAVTMAPVAAVPAPSPGVIPPPPRIQASAPETVKVFRPEPTAQPIRVATPALAEPAKPIPVVMRPRPTPPPVKPVKPAPALIRIKAMPAKPVRFTPPPPPKPVRLAKAEKSAKTAAPARAVAQTPPRARAKPVAAPAKTRVEIAHAGPLKPAPARPLPTKPTFVKAKPYVAPDSTPWMTKLEAVLKRPAPAEAKVVVAPQPKAAPAVERKVTSTPAETKPAQEAAAIAERAKPSVTVERAPAPTARLTQPQATRQEVRRDDVQPSFDCRSAVTRGQRLVCNEPSLAAADRRLSSAFNKALNEVDNPRALIAEQNRWLAVRDQLAPNYQAVMNLYLDRIAELRQSRY